MRAARRRHAPGQRFAFLVKIVEGWRCRSRREFYSQVTWHFTPVGSRTQCIVVLREHTSGTSSTTLATTTTPPTATTTNHHNHHNHYQHHLKHDGSRSRNTKMWPCRWLAATTAEGAAPRRRERRLYQRQSVATALAKHKQHASRGHEAGPGSRWSTSRTTSHGDRNLHLRGAAKRPRGTWPQKSDHTVRRSARNGLPTLGLPELAPRAAHARGAGEVGGGKAPRPLGSSFLLGVKEDVEEEGRERGGRRG